MLNMTLTIIVLFILIEQSFSQDMRSFHMSIMSGWEFQCANTTCLPFTTIIGLTIRECQISCLAQIQCQAATFQQSTTFCQLFANPPNTNNSMVMNADTETMIVTTGTRFPPVSNSIEETTQQTSVITTEYSTSQTMTTTCSNPLISPAGQAPTIAWYFENNLNDYYGKYNGTGQNNPAYLIGRNGCGKCLNLSSSLSQSVIVSVTPYIDLRPISFSVEAWLKPRIISDGLEHVILAQCGALATQQCMRTSIGSPGKMSFLFRSDNQLGNKNSSINVWSHYAYVYNLTAHTMSLYYNGTLDVSVGSHGPYQGAPTSFQIGNVNSIGSIYFDGCIDEIFFYPFARTASDIAATFALG